MALPVGRLWTSGLQNCGKNAFLLLKHLWEKKYMNIQPQWVYKEHSDLQTSVQVGRAWLLQPLGQAGCTDHGGPAGRPLRAAGFIIFRSAACGPLFVLLPWAYKRLACHLAGDAGCQAAHGRTCLCAAIQAKRKDVQIWAILLLPMKKPSSVTNP